MKDAIYIPAYSDGLMGMFYGKTDKEEIKTLKGKLHNYKTSTLEDNV